MKEVEKIEETGVQAKKLRAIFAPHLHNSASQLRRRRARRRFSLAFSVLAASLVGLLAFYLAPDMSSAPLSAKPAPSGPHLSATMLALPPMQRRVSHYEIKSGDTLDGLLSRAGVDAVTADAALDVLRQVFDPRTLKPGQQVRLYQEWPRDVMLDDVHPKQNAGQGQNATQDSGQEPISASIAGRFAGFDFIPEARRKVVVRRTGHLKFISENQVRPLTNRYFMAETLVTSSVYEAARRSGIAPNLVVRLIRLFSFTTDFQRDIREGDQLEVLYTRRYDDANQLAEEGDIHYAALTNRGKRHAYWMLPQANGTPAYYDENGKSVKRLLMKTPVDGARLSSRFGLRRHPILGYTRIHRGLDFAAPTGTPIFAAGDGTITRMRKRRNYGKHIYIKHRNNYQTLYAHLSRYARGMRVGRRVKQGQVIGYVGSSGLATGPHLHYEVLHYGKAVNPRTITLPSQRKLSKAEYKKLDEVRADVQARINGLTTSATDTATNSNNGDLQLASEGKIK